jgi:hypothetical protein
VGVILCDAEDIQNRLGGRDLSSGEQSAWRGLAEEATVLIEGYLDREWEDDDNDEDTVPAAVPLNVRVVCSRMVARALTSGPAPGMPTGAMIPGTKSFNSSMGPMGHTTTFGDDVVFGSPWLSRADKVMLRRKMYVEHVATYPEKSVGCGDFS